MLYVVYQNICEGADPVMVAVFLMRWDAEEFVKNQYTPEKYYVEEVTNVWGYWSEIRSALTANKE
jgi:hypothetical protein